MNPVINEALKRAAEKIVHRPLRRDEETSLFAGFYSGEGALCDRILRALGAATGVPRGLIERAGARSAGTAGIGTEIATISETWAVPA